VRIQSAEVLPSQWNAEVIVEEGRVSAEVQMESTEDVRVAVRAPSDPTGDPVEVAFTVPPARPADGDWVTAAWEAEPIYIRGVRRWPAVVLVGPTNDGVDLAPGRYSAWARVTDVPQVPVMAAGTVTVAGTAPAE
jgi:hypothetical protein